MPFLFLAAAVVSFSFGFLMVGLRAAGRADEMLELELRPRPDMPPVPVRVGDVERPRA